MVTSVSGSIEARIVPLHGEHPGGAVADALAAGARGCGCRRASRRCSDALLRHGLAEGRKLRRRREDYRRLERDRAIQLWRELTDYPFPAT